MILVKDAQNFKGLMKMCKKITDLIKENPRTTLLELEQDTGISKTTIGRIVTEDLKLKKTPAKFIPRFLTNEQKLCRLATCEDMMEMTRTDPEWKDKIITGDETWVYGYDPETKPQSAEWRGILNVYFSMLNKKHYLKKLSKRWTNLSYHRRKKCPMRESNPGRSGRKPNGLTSLPSTPILYFDSVLSKRQENKKDLLDEMYFNYMNYECRQDNLYFHGESRQDYHNEGDHNEEGKKTVQIDRRAKKQDGGTSTPIQRNDQAIFPQRHSRTSRKISRGDFELDNDPCGKPPQKFKNAELQALLDEDSTQTQEKLAKQLQVSQGAVSLRLNSLGMIQKLSRWVPHELSERQQERRLVTCEGLLARHEK
ncbi:hypothetical protein LAZ67_9003408 [Cordylochernes scorpioides]|uniref:Mariner Mos1 transposase n=1 Tax=Cordylochernes scorpioides TaxID=51811 RepID=A0ABY6KUH1_9ARAC|nr:hypothetical protein LAZ67_9003408 [Cordylochernes scorpioides]